MMKDFLIWYLRSLVEIISVSGQFVEFYKKSWKMPGLKNIDSMISAIHMWLMLFALETM